MIAAIVLGVLAAIWGGVIIAGIWYEELDQGWDE